MGTPVFKFGPTGSLDDLTSGTILNLRDGCTSDHGTMVIATHDPDWARFGSRQVVLGDASAVSSAGTQSAHSTTHG